jgi:hypothetical protein
MIVRLTSILIPWWIPAGCFSISTVFSHAQTVVICSSCSSVLCQPTGGRARLTEGKHCPLLRVYLAFMPCARELIPSEELSTLYHVFTLLSVYAAACTLDTHSDWLLAISPIKPVRIQTLTQHLRMGACVRASGQPTNGGIILLGAYKVF